MISFDIPQLNLNEFTYLLPENKIAFNPPTERGKSKCLIWSEVSGIIDSTFSDIPNLIQPNSLIIRNNSKVITARINSVKSSGGRAEVFCIEPVSPSKEMNIALSAKYECSWKCIVGGKKINNGSILFPAESGNDKLKMTVEEKNGNEAIIRFNWESELLFAEVLSIYGKVPLPPYIKRDVKNEDTQNYQTIFAKVDGSVAAPTASLHFTEEIINNIKNKNCQFVDFTLHVGLGTFLPISSDTIDNHTMHSEKIIIYKEEVQKIIDYLLNNGENIIASGTTAVRLIESLIIYGKKLEYYGYDIDFAINQWDGYDTNLHSISKSKIELLNNVITKINLNNSNILFGHTSLLILPGYKFEMVNSMFTNFHQPNSTLILLVAAFCGDNWKNIYNHALSSDYRFLSYGDGSYLTKGEIKQ